MNVSTVTYPLLEITEAFAREHADIRRLYCHAPILHTQLRRAVASVSFTASEFVALEYTGVEAEAVTYVKNL